MAAFLRIRADMRSAALLEHDQQQDHYERDWDDLRLEGGGCDFECPSTADSTDNAGVIMPSPKKSAAPNSPSSIRTRARAGSCTPRNTSAISAMMPPSPLLSARMMKTTYLIDTTPHERSEDERQNAEDVLLGHRYRMARAADTSFSAYSGLVLVAVDDAQCRQRQRGETLAPR